MPVMRESDMVIVSPHLYWSNCLIPRCHLQIMPVSAETADHDCTESAAKMRMVNEEQRSKVEQNNTRITNTAPTTTSPQGFPSPSPFIQSVV